MTFRYTLILILLALLIASGCAQKPTAVPLSELEQLLVDVFDPQAGENVIVMIDLPHELLPDNPAWLERRQMAEEWHAAFNRLAKSLDFSVQSILTFPATGSHNGPLPVSGEIDGNPVNLEKVLSSGNIVVAMTEFSATAPLFEFTEKIPGLRAASMPMVSRSMEQTALAADYGQIAVKSQDLKDRLSLAEGARLTFSTGHELFIDLRHREAEADDGQLHAGKEGSRVINLPSGEAFIAPYEGETPNQASKTEGSIPVPIGEGEYLTLKVVENQIVEALGDSSAAEEVREIFAVDEARRNLAELGLGCNDMAVISGNVLEDEKVMGVHLAVGLSEHIGGSIGVDDFSDPANALHLDRVYPAGGDIEVTTLVLMYEDGTTESIIENGRYSIFE